MKLARRISNALYGWYDERAEAAFLFNRINTGMAALVAPLANPVRVTTYIDRCYKLERDARRWELAIIGVGGLVPTLMWGAANLFGGGWTVVAAQFAWLLAWLLFGSPYLLSAVQISRAEMQADFVKQMIAGLPPDSVRAAVEHVRAYLFFSDDDPL